MSKKLNILAFFFIGILGTVLHFAYEWSGNNPVIGIFSTTDESVFQHQKMLFFPAVLYFLIEFFLTGYKHRNYIPACTIGILSGIFTEVSLFYTYSGIVGHSVLAVDIILYFLSVLVTLLIRCLILKSRAFIGVGWTVFSLILIIGITILFGIWTYNPPEILFFIPKE